MEGESILSQFKKNGMPEKSVVQTLAFRLFGLLLIFLLQVMLARLMGPKHYGDYTVIITAINLFLTFSLFGFDTSVLRFLPSLIAKKQFSSATGFIKFSYRVITFLSVFCSIGIFIFLLVKSKKFNISFSEGLFWGVLVLPFLAFMYQASSVLRAMKMVKLSLSPSYFIFPLLMGAVSAYYYHSEKKLTVDAAMLINLICTALICIFINRRAGRVIREVIPENEPVFDRRLWLSVSSVLFLTTAMDVILKQSDILMVGYFLGNTKAGIYSVAARLATLSAIGLSVTDFIVMPKIAALFESRQFSKLQKMIRSGAFQVLSISLPVIFFLIIFGKPLLGSFGEVYKTSYVPLLILLAGQVINCATGMVGGLMTMTGHQRTFFMFYAGALCLQFVLNIVFIRLIGINGAALGSAIAMIFLNVSGYTFVRKNLRIKASVF